MATDLSKPADSRDPLAPPEASRVRAQFRDHGRVIEAKSGDSLTIAMSYWLGFPTWVEAITANWEGDERFHLIEDLERVHHAAAQFLVEIAERLGMDGGPLMSSARLCADLFREDSHQYRVGRFDTWPACLGTARRRLSPEEQRVVTAGEEAIHRLAAKVDIDVEEPQSVVAGTFAGSAGLVRKSITTDPFEAVVAVSETERSGSKEFTSRPDGPDDLPRFFWWKGERHTLSKRGWSILRALWPDKHVTFLDLGHAVWGQEKDKRTISPAISTLNGALAEHSIPIVVTTASETAYIDRG